jgi:asparagine synthase (glutamine-hydrolysing)
MNVYLPSDILVKVDRTSMANSLEVRAPFLDHEFLTWAFSLPAALKIDKRGGKVLLKQAMEPFLSSELLYRPKQGFSVPLAEWLRGPLRPMVADLPQSETLRSCGMFALDTIAARVAAHLDGGMDHSKSIWLLLVFDSFLGHLSSSAR